MRRFSIYNRDGIYYARIFNPKTKKIACTRSTGQRDRDEAAYIAMGWIKNGIPSNTQVTPRPTREIFEVDDLLFRLKNIDLNEPEIEKVITIMKKRGFIHDARMGSENRENLIDFLIRFWDYDNSPYIQDKLAHGQKITHNHANNKLKLIGKYWKLFFTDLLLTDLTRQQINDFSIWLSKQEKTDRKGRTLGGKLSTGSLNNIIKTGIVALKWAANNKLIPENPAEGMTMFSGKSKKRGILSDKEVQKLFEKGKWTGSPANKLGNWTAAQTGLRMGEIVGLRVQDILTDRIKVIHSYSEHDGLKSTKTGEERDVAIMPDLSEKLLEFAKLNPHGYKPSSFVFWHISESDRPHAGKNLQLSLYRALKLVNIDDSQRAERGICFHSWRHFYTDKMSRELGQKAAKLTGHATQEMLDHYANHANEKDFEEAKRATSTVFGKVLKFEEVAV